MKSLYIVLAVFVALSFVSCNESIPESNSELQTADSLVNINQEWGYFESGLPYDSLTDAHFTTSVNIPHCWNAYDAVDQIPGYRRDVSWYRKTLTVENLQEGLQYLLYFEGSNLTTNVYVNGKHAGSHVGGYVGFEVDVTAQLKAGENEIAISVDNSVNLELIPSQKSDFVVYGGITRDLWLKTRPKTAFNDFTTAITHQGGQDFQLAILVDDAEVGKYKADVSINGEIIASGQGRGNLNLDLKDVELWDLDNPTLHTVRISKVEDEKVIYYNEKKVGFRYTKWNERGGFELNGKQVLIRGTHRHEEGAGMGAAVSNKMHREDMELIKHMGGNFVRLAHYPQDPEVYKACDEIGLLVWDELPWCRGGLGNEKWQSTTKKLLKEQINQNMHHPSIIMWSMGNEMYWDADFEGGGAIEPLRAFLTELCQISKDLDPTRPTCIRKFYEGADIVDVFSPSIWAGWYRGKYGEYDEALEDSREKYPRFVHMEYGAAAHMGRHDAKELSVAVDGGWEEDPTKVGISNMAKKGTWSETYAVDLFDWHLHVSENKKDFTGNAQWALKDFATPLRPENPIPYINQKGIMDRAGKPKDAFFVFKSYWNTTDPFVYIQSHTWTERQGQEGETLQYRVYSNCDSVQLTLNGIALGGKSRDKAKFPAQGLYWNVILKEGENSLKATGTMADESVVDNLTVDYSMEESGPADKITLESVKEGELYRITATVVDNEGRTCQDYRERIYFDCNGGGTLLGDLGTNDGSLVIEPMNGKASIFLNPGNSKASTVEVRNQDFKGSYLVVPVE